MKSLALDHARDGEVMIAYAMPFDHAQKPPGDHTPQTSPQPNVTWGSC
jgi:hypothetical protein